MFENCARNAPGMAKSFHYQICMNFVKTALFYSVSTGIDSIWLWCTCIDDWWIARMQPVVEEIAPVPSELAGMILVEEQDLVLVSLTILE